jgi:hypothetical protein
VAVNVNVAVTVNVGGRRAGVSGHGSSDGSCDGSRPPGQHTGPTLNAEHRVERLEEK